MDWDGSFASRAVMTGDAELWRAASEDARLTAVERERLNSVLAVDEALRSEVVYLVEHLSANLGGAFIRAFVQGLGERRTDQPAAALVLPALEGMIGAGDRRGDARNHG